jgi:spore germination cell wall hydrolase CwlJ-like protein
MRRLTLAAAFAVVTLSFGGAAAFADSSAPSAPAITYAAHAAAPTSLDQPGFDILNETAQRVEAEEVSAPVAAHLGDPAPSAPAAPVAAPAIQVIERDASPLETPSANTRRSLTELVRDLSSNDASSEQADCMARAVYFESKGEPLSGQLAVAEVILNRSRSGRFASTVCGVIRQPSQFSFVRRGVIPTPPQNAQWRTAVAIAEIAMQDLADGGAPRALFFHARRVSPGWRNLTRVATVGNHVFYR